MGLCHRIFYYHIREEKATSNVIPIDGGIWRYDMYLIIEIMQLYPYICFCTNVVHVNKYHVDNK